MMALSVCPLAASLVRAPLRASHCWTGNFFSLLAIRMGVQPLVALVMSAAAPTSNSHLHTDRWPFMQALYMGVMPSLLALVMSVPAPTLTSHLHTNNRPYEHASNMGVRPSLFTFLTSSAAPLLCSHLQTLSSPFWHAAAIGHLLL